MSYSPLDKEASERLEDDFDNDRAVGQVSTVPGEGSEVKNLESRPSAETSPYVVTRYQYTVGRR